MDAPPLLPWPDLRSPERGVKNLLGIVYDTATSLEEEEERDQARRARLVAQPRAPPHVGSAAAGTAATLIKIRREIDAQREMLHNLVQPAAGFEERLKAMKERERVEQKERADRIKARYDKSRKLKEERDAQRAQAKEEEARQLRRRAGSLVGAPRRLPPLCDGSGQESSGQLSPTRDALVLSLTPLHQGERGATSSVEPDDSFITQLASSSPAPSPSRRPFSDEDAEEQLNALRDLRIAQEAEETLQKAMLRTHSLVLEANRRAVRAILHSAHDLKGFLFEPAADVQRFARAAVAARTARRVEEATARRLLLEIARREEEAESKRLSALVLSNLPGSLENDEGAEQNHLDARSGAVGRSGGLFSSQNGSLGGTGLNVTAFVLDVIDNVGLVLTREYVTADLAAGRL